MQLEFFIFFNFVTDDISFEFDQVCFESLNTKKGFRHPLGMSEQICDN